MTNYMGRHSLQTANHRLESWVYADATARAAATGFTADDIGRIAFQQSDTSYWRLSDDSPPTWQTVTGGASSADLATHAAIDSTQTIKGHTSWEMIQDMLQTFLVQGTGITLTYDDTANTLTVVSTGGLTTEQVQDIVGAFVIAGDGITVDYNDIANTLTITADGIDISTFNVEDMQTTLDEGTIVSVNGATPHRLIANPDILYDTAQRHVEVGPVDTGSGGAGGSLSVEKIPEADGNSAVDFANAYTNPTQPTSQYAAWHQVTGANDTNVAGHFHAVGGTKNYAIITDGGIVGIGVGNPTEKLEVDGNIKAIGGDIILDAGQLVDDVDVSALYDQVQTLGGGGASVAVQTTAPSSPSAGDLWLDTDEPAANAQNYYYPLDKTPASPHAKDDEFLTVSLDGKWSQISSAVGTTPTLLAGTFLGIEPSASGGSSTGLHGGFGYRQVAPTGSFSISAKIREVLGQGGGDDTRAGLFAAISGTGVAHIIGSSISNARLVNADDFTYSESGDWSAYAGYDNYTGSPNDDWLWLKMVWDAGASTLSFQYSTNGFVWRELAIRSGQAQPNRIGLAMWANGGALKADHAMFVDWFRVTEP